MLALKQQQRWTTTAFHGLRSAGHRTVLTRCGLVTSTRVNSTDPVNKNQNDSHATHDDVSPAYLPPSGRRLLQLKDQLRKQHAKMGRPASAKGRSTVPHNARKRPALPPYRDLPVVDDKLKFRAFYTDGNRTGASALLARNGVSGKVTVDHFLDALYPRGAATGVTVEDDGASTMKAIVDGKDERMCEWRRCVDGVMCNCATV